VAASWQILTTLSSDEAAALERIVDRAVDAYLEANPDCTDTFGEVSATGIVPSEKEASEAHSALGVTLQKAARERLRKCRSSLTIEEPGELASDPLQVSILRFLLERAGDCLVLLGAYPLKGSSAVLKDLAKLQAAEGFGEDLPEEELEAEDEEQDTRAERILATFEAAEDNVDLAIDLRAQLGRASEPARSYAMLLVQEGPIDDEKAAKKLKLEKDAFSRAANELESLLRVVRSR
jgi:hypothetical protein